MDLFGEPDAPQSVETTEEAADLTATTETVEGLHPPRQSNFCIGHEAIETKLLSQFKAGRMPHAFVLSGSKGIGKATFAYRLARFLLKQGGTNPNQDALFDDAPAPAETLDVAPEDPTFRKVASGGHPDLISIERTYDSTKDKFKDTVAVEEVRKVAPFLHRTASKDGGWRVVIVDDADHMTRQAQNAILKILEEPPTNTAIILVCHRLGALIPTIRSRAQVYSAHALDRGNFESLLIKQGYNLDTDQLDTVYHLAGGSIGSALEIIEQGGLDTLAQILTAFESWPRWSWKEIHTLTDQLARSGYENFTFLLPWIYTQMINAKARGEEISSKALQISTIEGMHRQSSLETLLKICENLTSHFERVDRANLDKRQAVLGAFTMIAA